MPMTLISVFVSDVADYRKTLNRQNSTRLDVNVNAINDRL